MKAFKLTLVMMLISFLGICALTYQLWQTLPSSKEISEISCIEPIQVFTKDHILIGEIGTTKRYPQKIENIPPLMQSAFIAVEDVRFYQHYGVDIRALVRATVAVILAQKKIQGGSTITMQVARNFYLKRHKTFLRKYKEILLAIKIESLLEKNRILELYLNKIFLGHNSYGVEAASRTYFGKSVQELSLSEIAALAGLPKAPSVLNPITNIEKCCQRRNIVLKKMLDNQFISNDAYNKAKNSSLTSHYHPRRVELPLPHVMTLVKDELKNHPREHELKKGGEIITSIDSIIQRKAQRALDQGIEAYDRRHSYRGPQENIQEKAVKVSPLPEGASIDRAIVENISPDHSTMDIQVIKTKPVKKTLGVKSLKYIRYRKTHSNELKAYEKDFSSFKDGDIIYITKDSDLITQIPKVTGAVATVNQKGEIIALVSGLSYDDSYNNRAVQTKRQIGSTFKPFIYALALDNSYDIDTLIQDSAIIYEDKTGKRWTPQNDNMDYMGSISFEKSFIKSRNLSTLSLGSNLPLNHMYKKIENKINKKIENNHSSLLGTIELSPLQLAQLYTSFINEGKIAGLKPLSKSLILQKQDLNTTTDEAELFSSQSSYIMRHLLSQALKTYGLQQSSAGGKTGTTNEKQDLWFAGYKSNIISVVWMGFDKPSPLYEYASKNSAKVWHNAVKDLGLAEKESIPDGIIFKLGSNLEQRPYMAKAFD